MEINSTLSLMEDLNTTTEYVPCQNFETIEFKIQAALRSAVGLFSSVCCGSVVFIIILFKKYKFYTQRLILYLSIVTMIHAFSYVLTRVNYYTPRPIDDPYCYFSGALNHYTAANGVLSIWCITLNLLTKTLCNRSTVKAEPIFVAVIVFLPALWIWVPIWLKAYGTAGAWCDIRSMNSDCRTPYQYTTWLRFGLWYIPLYTLMFVIMVSLILAAVRISRGSRKWVGKWDPEIAIKKQMLKREVLSMMWYPLIFLLLNTFSLIDQIYDTVNPMNPSAVLTYLRIFTSTLRGAFVALAFGLDRETRSRLRPAQCRAACLEWVGERDTKIEDFVVSNSSFQESYVSYEAMTEEDNVIWNGNHRKSN